MDLDATQSVGTCVPTRSVGTRGIRVSSSTRENHTWLRALDFGLLLPLPSALCLPLARCEAPGPDAAKPGLADKQVRSDLDGAALAKHPAPYGLGSPKSL